ncbi:anti sigma factor C-terminal domain-containing protein [Niallia circulans]|nr:anti sigma factor C-terminal domain-containing protein [Niallia circulans]
MSITVNIPKQDDKRKTLRFLTGIIIIALAVLYIVAYFNLKHDVAKENMLLNTVKGANTQWKSSGKEVHLWSAISYFQAEKTIGGQKIVTNSMKEKVSVLGNMESVSEASILASSSYEDEGSKELLFYDPKTDYKNLPQELKMLANMDSNTMAELALSFDKAYSLAELEEKLGSTHVNWLWVDTATDAELSKMNISLKEDKAYVGDSTIGFQVKGAGFVSQGQVFLDKLKKLSDDKEYQKEAELVLTGINKSAFPSVKDIKVRGAVVSGTPEQLAAFMKVKIIKASTIGTKIHQL